MGQTTVDMASDLVAFGFANFSGYYSETRAMRLGYFPDPVCAHLAMCLMDEDFVTEIKGKRVKGISKKSWTKNLIEIFSTGIVSPEKGDFGEVVVALYMLFCGDLLRKVINENRRSEMKEYSQFSVSLDAWLQLMLSGGRLPDAPIEQCEISVGFIQVCRNSLRSYEKSWRSLADQPFLKHIFESGIAFYVFPGCPIIDMVVPLRITQGANTTDAKYIPMFVSIKSRATFPNPKELVEQCDAMRSRAEMLRTSESTMLPTALCLLILFGSNESKTAPTETSAKNKTITQQMAAAYTLKKGEKISKLLAVEGVVVRAVRIPANDAFGLTEAFKQTTPSAEIDSELFSSHSYLMAHGHKKIDDLDATFALRDVSFKKYGHDYSLLRRAMTEKKSALKAVFHQLRHK